MPSAKVVILELALEKSNLVETTGEFTGCCISLLSWEQQLPSWSSISAWLDEESSLYVSIFSTYAALLSHGTSCGLDTIDYSFYIVVVTFSFYL